MQKYQKYALFECKITHYFSFHQIFRLQNTKSHTFSPRKSAKYCFFFSLEAYTMSNPQDSNLSYPLVSDITEPQVSDQRLP